jgi:hypothetical protein
MTREDHLKFCSVCLNRKMDMERGLVCTLTGQYASFDVECHDFKRDESVKIEVNTTEPLDMKAVRDKLPAQVFEKLRLEQDLGRGVIAGSTLALVGAILWGTITVITEYQIGYMAIGIGAMVGYGIRTFGKGLDQIFGMTGAIVSLVGCMLGNFLSIIGFVANVEGLGYIETLSLFDYTLLLDVMIESFSPMDVFSTALL